VSASMKGLEGVLDVHDLHIWAWDRARMR